MPRLFNTKITLHYIFLKIQRFRDFFRTSKWNEVRNINTHIIWGCRRDIRIAFITNHNIIDIGEHDLLLDDSILIDRGKSNTNWNWIVLGPLMFLSQYIPCDSMFDNYILLWIYSCLQGILFTMGMEMVPSLSQFAQIRSETFW